MANILKAFHVKILTEYLSKFYYYYLETIFKALNYIESSVLIYFSKKITLFKSLYIDICPKVFDFGILRAVSQLSSGI